MIADPKTLDFMVKSTSELLGLSFTGSTEEEKQAFVSKHFEARQTALSQLFKDDFQEILNQRR